jgi:Flp pilus assembly protein TadG
VGAKDDKRWFHRVTGRAGSQRVAPATAARKRAASFRRSGWRRCGNAIIEVAIVLNVLTWVGMGMVEFGQYFYIKHAFEAAARDGARQATLPSATQTAVTSAITSTLQQANVTYNSSWLTIKDLTSNTTVTDISTVSSGHTVQLTLSVNYDQIPNVVRPLYSITGKGIKNGKPMTGLCVVLKE